MEQHSDQLAFDQLHKLGLTSSPSCASGFLEPKYQRSKGYRLLGRTRDLAVRAQKGQIKTEESHKTKSQLAELAFPLRMGRTCR